MPPRGTILSLFNMILPQKQCFLKVVTSYPSSILAPSIAGAMNYQVLFSGFWHLVLDFLLLGVFLFVSSLCPLFSTPLFHRVPFPIL